MNVLLQASPEHMAFVAVLAAAAGADLGLALLVVAVAPQLGWPEAPGALSLLQAPAVIVSLVVLYVLEWWVERRARGFALWHTMQRWVRLLTLGLVGTLVAAGDPLSLRIVTVAFVTVFGTVVYMGASGWVALVILRELPPRSQRLAALAVDVAFTALLVLALEEPLQAVTALGALTLLAATQLPDAIRAHMVVARAGRGWFHFVTLPGRWLDREDLPAGVRRAVDALGGRDRRSMRGAEAALLSDHLRSGWLVLTGGQPFFVEGRRGVRRLAPRSGEATRPGRLCLRKAVQADGKDADLLIFKDGPQIAELDREMGPPPGST